MRRKQNHTFVDILITGSSERNVKNNRANEEMPSLLGSDTNGASSQGGVPRLHMGLPSSVDRLSGTSSSTWSQLGTHDEALVGRSFT